MPPENQWLEDVFPTEIVPFSLFRGHVSFRGSMGIFGLWIMRSCISSVAIWFFLVGKKSLRFSQDVSWCKNPPGNSPKKRCIEKDEKSVSIFRDSILRSVQAKKPSLKNEQQTPLKIQKERNLPVLPTTMLQR